MGSPVTPGARRYARMFGELGRRGEGAFVPFLMLGDPDPSSCLAAARSLIAAGVDALELGLPFSDPIADGPVIQAAATRALRAGVRRRDCWRIVKELRAGHPDLPIGLLVYANLVCHRDPAVFYREAAEAGVDSVLIADLPIDESGLVIPSARRHGIAVFIAPPNADDRRLRDIAGLSEGYIYVTSREGVTGADDELRRDPSGLLARLEALGAAPSLIGFGISRPAQVSLALARGARGAISGSAVVERLADGLDLVGFARSLKEATRPG